MKQSIVTKNAPVPAGPYSQAIISEPFVFVAGQGPADPKTGAIAADIQAQTRQVLTNIRQILEASGCTMDDVVKVSAFLADLKDFDAYNQVYKEFFTEPFPVRTTVGCQLSNILVEIDVIARK